MTETLPRFVVYPLPNAWYEVFDRVQCCSYNYYQTKEEADQATDGLNRHNKPKSFVPSLIKNKRYRSLASNHIVQLDDN